MEISTKYGNNLYILALIIFAFLFSAAVRLTWVYQMGDIDSMKWNGEYMVTTNDSYYWAEGARDIVLCDSKNESMGEYYQKNCHQANDLSPVDSSVAKVTKFLHSVLPFSLETIIFYLPVFAASLVVIPFILIGARLNLLVSGFVAALVASVSVSYYGRTVVGYYDTDMFNIALPMFLAWAIISALITKDKKYILLTGLAAIIYEWWYPSAYSIIFSFCVLGFLHTLIFERKSFNYQLLAVLFIGLCILPFAVKLAAVLFLFIIFQRGELERYSLHIFILSVVAFFFTGGMGPVLHQLNSYVFQRSGTIEHAKLNFFSVTQTIVEAQGVSIDNIAARTSGNAFLFLIGIIGYAFLCLRKPIMLIMLPFFAIGIILPLFGGLRFIMYATPIAAFGIGFFIYRIIELLHEYIKDKKLALITSVVFACIMSACALYPLVKNGWEYRIGTVFVKDEVALIEEFGKNVSREDYVVSWWDYGYPLRYYADIKTLIDGAKHSGDVNFPVSFILSHDQKSAANLARLDVEYTEKRSMIEKENSDLEDTSETKVFSYLSKMFGIDYKDSSHTEVPDNNIAWMMKDYVFGNSNDFILSLKTDIKLPPKTRDIYLYLPYRMLDIYTTIMQFSYRDLMTGDDRRMPFIFASRNFKDTQTFFEFDNGYKVDKAQGLLVGPNQQKSPIKSFIKTGYDADGKFIKESHIMRYDGVYTLIYLGAYNTFLVVDDEALNSVYIKLFYLEEYDPKLFELVAANPYGKFFKLKI